MAEPSVPTDSVTARARGRVGGLTTASRHDMRAVAARAREGMAAKFLREANGDPVQAEVLRRLYYARLTLARVEAQKRKRTAPDVTPEAVHAVEDHGNDVDRAA